MEVPSAAAPTARRRSVVVEANIFGRASRVFRSYINAAGASACIRSNPGCAFLAYQACAVLCHALMHEGLPMWSHPPC